MKNIIFIAPPAAGKGTQSTLLENKYDYKHLSTGDLLRAEIKTGSDLGKEINEIISKGEFVSDELITKLLKNELAKVKHQKFILDGYPRNIAQAETLSSIFDELGIDNYTTIYLDLDPETAKKRALGRVVCSQCGASYNTYFQNLMPKKNGICDKCQGELSQRSDDNEEAFVTRFDKFIELTNPLLEYYEEKGVLEKVDSSMDTEDIFKNIEIILGSDDVDN